MARASTSGGASYADAWLRLPDYCRLCDCRLLTDPCRATLKSSGSGRSCATSSPSRRLTIDDLAARTGVTTRTIRRDLEALQEAGFPLFDEVHDGKRYWTLEQRAFRRLDDTGFTLAELSALYFTRTLVECLAATPFQQDVRNAFDKLAAALTPGMRQFLDRLPLAIQAKADPGVRAPARGDATIARRAKPDRARGAAPRRHAPSPPRRDALPLVLEQPREGLRASSRSGSSSRRAASTCWRSSRIQRAAHVLGRSHPAACR